ncbi:MAG: glycosyltransferase family 39 protein [Nanoarchaeota archaeon]|nr:glycosyltransferase family 39 protein [Nanoarchaeota archaeon]
MGMKLPSINYFKILHHLTIGLDFLFAFLLLFNYLNPLSEFWNLTYIFFFVLIVNTIFFAYKINKIHEDKRENSLIVYYINHLFCLSLMIIVLNQFLEKRFIIDIMLEFSVLCISLGFLSFYAHKNKIEKEIENKKVSEGEAEKKRFEEFNSKFPRISKIWGLRGFVRWMYKEGWGYSVGLILIIVWGFVLRIWNIGNIYYNVDESISGLAVEGFLGNLVPVMPSGFIYFREILSTIFLSVLPYLFGLNELSMRLTTILFGIGTIYLVYLFSKTIFNKDIAIISSLILSISSIEIAFSRWFRMYALLQFFSILCIYFIFKYYGDRKKSSIVFAFISLIVAFLVHRSGIILLLLFLPFLIEQFKKLKPLWKFLSWVLLLIITIALKSFLFEIYDKYIFGFGGYAVSELFAGVFNSYSLLIQHMGPIFLIILMVTGLTMILFYKGRARKYLFFVALFIIPLIIDIVIFSQGFNYRVRYVVFLIPFFVSIFSYGTYFLFRKIISPIYRST